jgi:hypothetical protein
VDIEEFRRHVAATELSKIINTLHDSRRSLVKATERIKTLGRTNPLTEAIETNIDALMAGLLETISMSAAAQYAFRQAMLEPDSRPLQRLGSTQVRATRFQRALMREGYQFPSTLPKYIPTKQDERTPHIIPFTLKAKPYNRRRGKKHMPL